MKTINWSLNRKSKIQNLKSPNGLVIAFWMALLAALVCLLAVRVNSAALFSDATWTLEGLTATLNSTNGAKGTLRWTNGMFVFTTSATNLPPATNPPAIPPQIKITNPGNGNVFIPPLTLVFSANVTAGDSPIEKVIWSLGGLPIATLHGPPWTVTNTFFSGSGGAIKLKAVAFAMNTGSAGSSGPANAASASDEVTFSVTPPPPVAPVPRGFPLPVWAIPPPPGQPSAKEEFTFVVTNPAAARLRAKVHGLTYPGKMGFAFNGGAVVPVKNETVAVQGSGAVFGGVGGAFTTIEFLAPLPANTLAPGTNTVAFWYFATNAFNAFFQHEENSYQVLEFNLLDVNGAVLIPPSSFPQEDQSTWAPYHTDPAALLAGQAAWTNQNTLRNALNQPIIAACADCHMRDGRDLKYFGYHNRTIVARAVSHRLPEETGRLIASFIRTRAVPTPVNGRPWNPPYQPGPGLDGRPLNEWAAGAGLGAVLANDIDGLNYLFPGGVITNTAISIEKRLSTRNTPTSLMMPDWNHWLPPLHPLDAFGPANVAKTKLLAWYDGGIGFVPGSSDEGYVLRRTLKRGDAASVAKAKAFWPAWDQQGHQAGANLRALGGIQDYDPDELDSQRMYSLALWKLVKTAELMLEFELEEIVPAVILPPSADARGWRGALAFEASPNMTHLHNSHHGIMNNTPLTWYYFSMAWYHVQIVVNGGSRSAVGEDYQWAQRPVDWSYQHGFLKDWPAKTGQGNAVMNLLYLTKGLQAMDNGRGPELWGNAGWNPATQYRIVDLFADKQGCFLNVSAMQRRLLVEAVLRNWIAVCERYPAASYALSAVGGIPPLAPNRGWTGPADATDYTARPLWLMFGTGSATMQGYGIDKALQNRIINWCKLVWPVANWDSRRPL